MPIAYVQGNMFESGCTYLVNPVNCVGVMGSGLALAFKKKFPSIMEDYEFWCASGILRPGVVKVHGVGDHTMVAEFPTKDHWKDPSRMWYVLAGLVSLRRILDFGSNVVPGKSIAIPALGCGLGGLDWPSVRPMIQAFAEEMHAQDWTVKIYSPQ